MAVNQEPSLVETEVLIIGSGPIGATYARKLVDAGIKVLMIDIGEQGSKRVGDHKKNSVAVQKDLSLFTNSVKGELSLLSVPVDKDSPYVEPISWDPLPTAFIRNGQNPKQLIYDNLPVAAASRVVGGMGSHWTCCTPEQHPKLERSDLFSNEQWEALYQEAKTLFSTSNHTFDGSIRQELVRNVLLDAYKDKGRLFEGMPLAGARNKPNKDYVEWTCPATIMGDIAEPSYNGGLFEIKPQHQCISLQRDHSGQVSGVLAKDLLTTKDIIIKAKKYVLCAGATLTPGILFNSGFRAKADSLPALGHYLTEQNMAFCQVVLKRSLVDSVIKDPYNLGWTEIVEEHQKQNPNDPLPFPFSDYDPQVSQMHQCITMGREPDHVFRFILHCQEYPFHTQIHRDAFGYRQVPEDIDQRLIVDLRWFSWVKPVYQNFVDFSETIQDGFGMPQPTHHFRIDEEDAERCHAMMKDMVEVGSNLGGFLPGAEPKYLPPGSALHICGTTHAGTDKADSVVDKNSKVWGQKDLYIGGCSVIPTQNACNPTLTAACFAIVGANAIVEDLRGEKPNGR